MATKVKERKDKAVNGYASTQEQIEAIAPEQTANDVDATALIAGHESLKHDQLAKRKAVFANMTARWVGKRTIAVVYRTENPRFNPDKLQEHLRYMYSLHMVELPTDSAGFDYDAYAELVTSQSDKPTKTIRNIGRFIYSAPRSGGDKLAKKCKPDGQLLDRDTRPVNLQATANLLAKMNIHDDSVFGNTDIIPQEVIPRGIE